MSENMVSSSPEKILHMRADDAPSRDEALVQSRRRASTEMIVASQPRIYDFASESVRAAFETAQDDDEESQCHFTTASDRIASQIRSTNTLVRVIPIEKKYHWEAQDRAGKPQYEITQTGLKFKGNVRGIKIIATQIASKEGQYASERHDSGHGEQKHQSQGHEKQDGGFVKQSGALFLQSVSDSAAEVNQSVEGKNVYKVMQDAVEVEGDTVECSFPIISQRVW